METLPELLKIYNNTHPDECFKLGTFWEIGCKIVLYSDGSGKIISGKNDIQIDDFDDYDGLIKLLKS